MTRLEVHQLVGAQAGAVAQHEGGAVLGAGRGLKDRLDLLHAQDLGQALGPARTRQPGLVPVLALQHVPEEAAQAVGGHAHARVAAAARGDLDLVGDDVAGRGLVERALVQEAREAFQRVQVIVDGALAAAGRA